MPGGWRGVMGIEGGGGGGGKGLPGEGAAVDDVLDAVGCSMGFEEGVVIPFFCIAIFEA